MNLVFHKTRDFNGEQSYTYFVEGTAEELEAYKENQGKYYRELEGIPLASTKTWSGNSASLVYETGKDGKTYAKVDGSAMHSELALIKSFCNGDLKAYMAAVKDYAAKPMTIDAYLADLDGAESTSDISDEDVA